MTSQDSTAQAELSELIRIFIDEQQGTLTPATSLADISATDNASELTVKPEHAEQYHIFFTVLALGSLVLICILRIYFTNSVVKHSRGGRENAKIDRIHPAHLV